MFRTFAFALAAVIIISIIKGFAPEHALLMRLAVITAVFAVSVSGVDSVVQSINGFSALGGLDSAYIKIALKLTGTAIVTQSVCDVCRDCGENALTTQVELSGRIIMLLTALPVIGNLIKLCLGIIG